MKKIAIALLAVLIFVCGVCLVACDNSKEVLDMYIFEKEGQQVSGEFTLPRVLGESVKVTWTSDNENLIKITDRSAEDRDFLATVTRPENVRTEVKLTVTAGKNSKTFSVYVAPYDVYDFSSAYKFKQDKATVTKDFDLDSETKIGDKKATIAWAVGDEASEAYIAVEGNKCKVTPSALDPQVYIKATFTYQGKDAQGNDKTQTTTKRFRMTVSRERNHLENVDYWYNNVGVSVDIKGYVAEIATPYDDGYKNVTLYVVDENFDAGYYVYRVGAEPEDGAKIKVGAYVTITGTTNTNYNGLVETNAGGTLKVDESKNMSASDLKAKCYALDNDILGKVPGAIFHTSQYVSLSKWKVTEICDAVEAVDNLDLFKIEKNGVKVTVRTSKYLAGAYSAATDKKFTDIVALQKTLKEGDIISIKGMLSNYKGYTILPISASDVTKETAADTDDAIKAMPGVKVGAVIAKLDKVIADNNLDLIVTKAKNVTLTPSEGDVTVKYSLLNQGADITLTEAGVLNIPEPTEHNKVHVQAEFTCGEYKTYKLFYVEVWNKTDAEMVADEKLDLFIDDAIAPAAIDLPMIGGIYGGNVQISWAIKDKANISWAQINETKDKDTSKVTALTLAVQPLTAANKLTLIATIKAGEVTDTREIEVSFGRTTVYQLDSSKIEDGASYYLVQDQSKVGVRLYANGKINNKTYGDTTTNMANAAKVTVEKVKDGYKLYFLDGKTKNYLGAVATARDATRDYLNVVIGPDVDCVWTITNSCISTVVKNVYNDGTTQVYIGTYNTYTTISVSDISKLSGSIAAYLAFEVGENITDNDKIGIETVNATAPEGVAAPGSYDLGTVKLFTDVTMNWSIKGTQSVASITGGKLVVAALPDKETKITLVAELTCGTGTKVTKELEVTIAAKQVNKVTTPVAGTAYKLVIDQLKLGQQLFAKNQMDGYYGASATKLSDGTDVYVESVEGGIKLYFKDGENKIYIGAVKSGTFYNIKFGAGFDSVWTLDTENNCIKTNVGTESAADWVYIGTYGSNKTFGVSQISKLNGSYAAYLALPVKAE